jgi:hypothetical protein
MTDIAEKLASRIEKKERVLSEAQASKGLVLKTASGLEGYVNLSGDRYAVVPKLLEDLRQAAILLREQSASLEAARGRCAELESALSDVRIEAKIGVHISFDTVKGQRIKPGDEFPPIGLWPPCAIKYSLIIDRVNELVAPYAHEAGQKP